MTSPMPLSGLGARVLHATDPLFRRLPARIAQLAGVDESVAVSVLRRLRAGYLVDADARRRPARWLRTRHGDTALEAQP